MAPVSSKQHGDLEDLRKADREELASVDEVGVIIADSVVDYLASDFGSETVDDLISLGLKTDEDTAETESLGDQLSGKTFVVTGTLSRYTREEIKQLIMQHGGKTSASVSGKTDYLIAGEKSGSKRSKAESLGVAILDEDGFHALLGNSE